MPTRTADGIAADFAAASSAAGASFTWIAQVNDVLQLLATAVAIVAGIYAIKWHKARISDLDRRMKEVHQVVVKEEPVDDE